VRQHTRFFTGSDEGIAGQIARRQIAASTVAATAACMLFNLPSWREVTENTAVHSSTISTKGEKENPPSWPHPAHECRQTWLTRIT
jgi:hypothetical protein